MSTVTIDVPAPVAHIPRPDGNPASAESLAESLYAVAGRYEEFGDAATTLQDLNDGWWGQAYTAYREAAGSASGEHASMAATIKRVGHAVSSYADTLTDLLRDHEQLADRRTALNGTRAQLIIDINATVEATPPVVSALRARSSDLAEAMDALATDRDTWAAKVQAAEDLLRRSFEAGTNLRDALSDLGGVSDLAQDAMG